MSIFKSLFTEDDVDDARYAKVNDFFELHKLNGDDIYVIAVEREDGRFHTTESDNNIYPAELIIRQISTKIMSGILAPDGTYLEEQKSN